MASTQPAKLRALYRSLVRELPPRPVLASPRTQVFQRLRENFTQSKSTTTPINPELAVAQTEQFLAYLQAQRQYTALLERYNPGMGMDEEERVRLSARRVGMDLPTEYGVGGPGKWKY